MPKKNKYKGRSAEKVGGGKAWRRGENKRLQRSTLNKYCQIIDGAFTLERCRASSSTNFFFFSQQNPGERGAQIFNGKTITASRSHVDVALAVAKKVWARNKRFESIEVMHLDSGKRFRFDPQSWQTNSGRKFKSNTGKSKYRQKNRFFTFDDDDVSSSSTRNLSICTPPAASSRTRKRSNSGLDDSPRASKSPRVSTNSGSTGLTPRLSAASIDREVSPLERPRRKLRQPNI